MSGWELVALTGGEVQLHRNGRHHRGAAPLLAAVEGVDLVGQVAHPRPHPSGDLDTNHHATGQVLPLWSNLVQEQGTRVLPSRVQEGL